MATAKRSPMYTEAPSILQHVPVPLRVTAAYSWRLIVVGVVAFALLSVVASLGAIVVPFIVALLIAAPLERAVGWLERHKIPRAAGALGILLLLVLIVAGLIAAASQSVISGFDELKQQAGEGLDTLIDWLGTGPLHLSPEQIQEYLDRAGQTISDNRSGIISSALSVTTTVGLVAAGTVLALFCLFFFLKDGRELWLRVVGWLPFAAQERVDYAGRQSWGSLARYTRTSVVVAAIDATGIGLGALLLGLKLALPIAIVVFLTSFIPLVGATLSGLAAVLVTVVEGGWVRALIMLGVVILVQQLEGNVLYPWLFGKAASVHPIAILLAVSTGAILAGMVGALLAVPTLAFLKSFLNGLRRAGVGPTSQIPINRLRSDGAEA